MPYQPMMMPTLPTVQGRNGTQDAMALWMLLSKAKPAGYMSGITGPSAGVQVPLMTGQLNSAMGGDINALFNTFGTGAAADAAGTAAAGAAGTAAAGAGAGAAAAAGDAAMDSLD